MTYRNATLDGKTLDLDNDHFHGCEIKRCILQYAGGGVTLDNCTLQLVGWNFTGAAGRTLNMLHYIYTSTPGGPQFIEQIIAQIKSGEQASPPVNSTGNKIVINDNHVAKDDLGFSRYFSFRPVVPFLFRLIAIILLGACFIHRQPRIVRIVS